MSRPKEDTDTRWVCELRNLFERLPDDYPTFYERISELRHAFQHEVAAALQIRMNAHLRQKPQHTLAEKQRIASDVNRDLRLLNLCLKCPGTGLPAILVADFRDDQETTSRFRFRVIEKGGRALRKHSSSRLPALEVQEAPPREESFADRSGAKSKGDRGR